MLLTPLLGALAMAGPESPKVAGSDDFAAALYAEVARGGDANVAISPTSARTALLMVWAGADGSTREAMARSLRLDRDDGAVLDQYAAWSKASATPADAPYELTLANRLWGSDQLDFHEEYLRLAASVFDAPMTPLDFRDARGSVDAINAWCSEQTRGRIPEILGPDAVGADTSLVLTNAVYLLGSWKQTFDATQTRPQRFTRADGSTVDTPLMFQQATAGYAETDGLRVIRLPYDGERLWFVGVLPEKGHDLSLIEKKLSGPWLRSLPARTRPTDDVRIWIPTFELDRSYELNAPLKALGMGEAFTDRADFSRIAAAPTHIDRVLQKTFIRVDEKGTEAAAVTAVTMVLTSMPAKPPPPPPEWRGDRPFLFMLWDSETEEILFLGHIGDPSA